MTATALSRKCNPTRRTLASLFAIGALVVACESDRDGSVSRPSDASTTAPATTAASSASTVATMPETTSTMTVTEVTEVTEIVIPNGAIDLGHGASIPVPDGWELEENDSDVATLTDGTLTIALQVLERPPGEDPATLVHSLLPPNGSGEEPSLRWRCAASRPPVRTRPAVPRR